MGILGNQVVGQRLVERGYPAIALSSLTGRVTDGVVQGRYPSHGYVRGVGLEFGEMPKLLYAHPLYREALAAARGRSIVHEHRLMNLFLLIACYFDSLPDHNIIEFGSYRGGSALFMAHLLKRLYPEARLYAHDTFAGMPAVNASADLHCLGDFADADLPGLRKVIAEQGQGERLHLVQGLVQDTFPRSVPAAARFGLVHLDMDIYEPTAFAQEAAWPIMSAGGYFVYDDATVSSCIGATLAVEDLIRTRGLHSEQVYPHFVFRIGLTPP